MKYLIYVGSMDYNSGPYNITFHAGETTAALDISITDDNLLENDETFAVIIDPTLLPVDVTVFIADNYGYATVTIVDDDSKLRMYIWWFDV